MENNTVYQKHFFTFFLKTLPRNIVDVFRGRNILRHGVAIVLTVAIVLSGFDWWYFVHTRAINSVFYLPAVILGAFIPILIPAGMLLIGYVRKSDIMKKLGYMLGQAALIGSIISSVYKAFTGRIEPAPDSNAVVDISREFNFGFLEHGIFWGWPSSHTAIAFAMVVALITLFPKNRKLKVAGLFYAFYTGFGVSVSIHWFSDFAAGAIIGSVIGVVVGRAFRKASFSVKTFYNPTLAGKSLPGFKDVFRMLRESRAEWPRHVENPGVPRLDENPGPRDISITFVNHATFLIRFPHLNILVDPVWSNRVSPVSWFGPKRVREPGIRFEDLPEIDVLLISHNHYDHLDVATLKNINKRFSPTVLVPVGNKRLIESIGMKNVHELDWWESIRINADTHITFAPAQHSSGRGLFDRDRSLWGSYFIQRGERSLYFGGDAGYSTHYAEITKRLGSPDVALLGIGAYLPRWFMQPMHMDPFEAVLAHKDLGAKLSIGMHFGTFQLSSEAIDQPQQDLKEALIKENLSPDSFITLHEGETMFYGDKMQVD